MRMRNRRPFQANNAEFTAAITHADYLAKKYKIPYRVFFSTSGALMVERLGNEWNTPADIERFRKESHYVAEVP